MAMKVITLDDNIIYGVNGSTAALTSVCAAKPPYLSINIELLSELETTHQEDTSATRRGRKHYVCNHKML